MRKLLNVLYVTNEEAYLSKDGEDISILIRDQKPIKIPSHNLEGIVCFGYQGASTKLMAMCAEKNIGMSFILHLVNFFVEYKEKFREIFYLGRNNIGFLMMKICLI